MAAGAAVAGGQKNAGGMFPSFYKTWFFTGRPGYVLTSLQLDITNGAVHETWTRT